MPNLTTIIGILVLAGSNYIATGWFVDYAKRKNITDIPTDRSSHSVPTPRGGGLGFVTTSIIAFIVYFAWNGFIGSGAYISFIITLSIVASLGWFDDKMNLSQSVRFTIQVASAAVFLFFIGGLDTFSLPFTKEFELGYFSYFLGIFWIVGVTNIYNFMDGVDGLATAQALTASAGWIVFALLWSEQTLFTINMVVFSTVLVFLVYNWAPAKIFMGDVGSLFLGFFFAVMPFIASSMTGEHTISSTFWIGVLLLWPFLFDSSSTIIRRFVRGENIFEAHRSHLYQHLNIAGWSHSKIATLYLSFSLLCMGLSLIYFHETDIVQVFILLSLLILSFLYLWRVIKFEKN